MTSDLPPSSIAYAIPEHDRADGRVRRVLAFAAIALGAAGTGTTIFFLALVFGLVPSSLFGGARQMNGQMTYQVAGVVLDLLLLVGGAMLLRADAPVARLLIRIGAGAKVAVAAVALLISLAHSSYPSSFTIGDRVYLLFGNALGYLVVPATLFLLTFALPPARSR